MAEAMWPSGEGQMTLGSLTSLALQGCHQQLPWVQGGVHSPLCSPSFILLAGEQMAVLGPAHVRSSLTLCPTPRTNPSCVLPGGCLQSPPLL